MMTPAAAAAKLAAAGGRQRRRKVPGKQDLTKAKSAPEDDGSAPVAPPCAMVIFGATGDLTKRLVVPALYDLVNEKRLSKRFHIVGVDLAAKTTEEWCRGLTEMMNEFVAKGDGEFRADHIARPPGAGL